MKTVYLGAFRALHPGFDILYNDINGLRDNSQDMLYVDLSSFDFLIASPPCNFWSRARDCCLSLYSLATGYLLPCILKKFIQSGKLFVVENVSNISRFKKFGIMDLPCLKYKIGRHIYFTNIELSFSQLKFLRSIQKFENVSYLCQNDRQGGYNVHVVIDYFLNLVDSCKAVKCSYSCFNSQLTFNF